MSKFVLSALVVVIMMTFGCTAPAEREEIESRIVLLRAQIAGQDTRIRELEQQCASLEEEERRRMQLNGLDYFPDFAVPQVQYRLTDDLGGLDCEVVATTIGSEAEDESDAHFDVEIITTGSISGSLPAVRLTKGRSQDSTGMPLLSLQTPSPLGNPADLYALFSLPRAFVPGDSWQVDDAAYRVDAIGTQAIGAVVFGDCIRIDVDHSRSTAGEYQQGVGHFVVARGIGIVRLVFERLDGTSVVFDHAERPTLIAAGTIELHLAPNPAPLEEGKWAFDLVMKETGGVGVRLSSLEIQIHGEAGIVSEWSDQGFLESLDHYLPADGVGRSGRIIGYRPAATHIVFIVTGVDDYGNEVQSTGRTELLNPDIPPDDPASQPHPPPDPSVAGMIAISFTPDPAIAGQWLAVSLSEVGGVGVTLVEIRNQIYDASGLQDEWNDEGWLRSVDHYLAASGSIRGRYRVPEEPFTHWVVTVVGVDDNGNDVVAGETVRFSS